MDITVFSKFRIIAGKTMIILLACLLTMTESMAELVLTAPPRETPEAGEAVYAPLANYLSSFLGEPVIYEHPVSWKRYEQKMKNDEYDFVFDGPHFAAWRIDTLLNEPLVKLPGSLRFVLIAKKLEGGISRKRDFIGKVICTLAAPNLGALTLFSMFPYPARQPEYLIINGGFKQVAHAFKNGECDGAILRSSYYYKKTDQSFRESTKVIKRSKGLTNQGITVSRRVDPGLRRELVDSLIRGDGKKALKPILERFYSQSNKFMPASKTDYNNHNLLRDTVIYGW